MIEVEQILQRIGKLIAIGEVQAYVINRQKAALDQRQQRRMIANAVRNVARFRERGNCNEWKAGTQLIKIGALQRIRTSWIGSQRRAEQFCIHDAGIDGAYEIRGTFCASTWLLAGRRIGEIGALSGSNSIRRQGSALLGLRRFGMIVESAVIVVGINMIESSQLGPLRTAFTI